MFYMACTQLESIMGLQFWLVPNPTKGSVDPISGAFVSGKMAWSNVRWTQFWAQCDCVQASDATKHHVGPGFEHDVIGHEWVTWEATKRRIDPVLGVSRLDADKARRTKRCIDLTSSMTWSDTREWRVVRQGVCMKRRARRNVSTSFNISSAGPWSSYH